MEPLQEAFYLAGIALCSVLIWLAIRISRRVHKLLDDIQKVVPAIQASSEQLPELIAHLRSSAEVLSQATEAVRHVTTATTGVKSVFSKLLGKPEQ